MLKLIGDLHFVLCLADFQNDTTDPWFKQAFEKAWNCSSTGGISKCPVDRPIGEKYSNVTIESVSRLMDAVFILARAAARVLDAIDCANSTRSDARECIKGPQLLEELMFTDEVGYSGYLTMDENGDRLDTVDIFQYIGEDLIKTKVAEYDTFRNVFNYVGKLTWQYHNLRKSMPLPESHCSTRCKPGEIRIPLTSCCVRCIACRPNERLVENKCQACPPYKWPDEAKNFTTCVDITFEMRIFSDLVYTIQMILSAIGLLVCIAVGVFFVYHRNTNVIKASSRELSFIILFAIFLGYSTALSFLAIPSRLTCIINYVMFCASFNLIYGPLLVKTVRIYRIFSMSVSSTGGMKLKLIGGVYQVFFSFVLLFFQVSGH